MKPLSIEVRWPIGVGPDSSMVAEEFNKPYHFVSRLLSWKTALDQAVVFAADYWPLVSNYAKEIQAWLEERGVAKTEIFIDDLTIEEFYRVALSRARRDLMTAIRRIKAGRRLWPNARAREERWQMEETLSYLEQALRPKS